MSKVLKPFENHLREVMSNYEAPYDAHSWQDLQKRISGKAIGNSAWVVAALSTLLVSTAVTVGIYKQRNTPSTAQISQSEPRFSSTFSIVEIYKVQQNDELTAENQHVKNDIVSHKDNRPNVVETNAAEPKASITIGDIIENEQRIEPDVAPITVVSKEKNQRSKKIDFKCNISEGCEGVEVDFQVNGPTKGSYLWNFGDGKYSNDVNPKHKFTKAGVYDVSLSITDDYGHITVTTMPDMVVIHPAPDASFEWDFVNESPENPTVKIINTSEHAVKYEWKFADGTSSHQVSPIKSLDGKGKHTVALEVTNENGCSDATVKQISVNSDYLGEQSSITPGKQVFMPNYLKENKQNFKLEIYDAAGNKVFETTNRKEGWDGTLADKSIAPAGSSYWWKVIIFPDNSKEEKYFNGTLKINP